MTQEIKKPTGIVYWLSVINVLYLLSLPVFANITIVPLLEESSLRTLCWFYFGFFGITLAFAGLTVFYPFPRDLLGALMRTFLLPFSAALWWWYQESTLVEYFTIMLIYESLAMFLSIFLMCFIPMKYYNPDHPKARGIGNYLVILIFEGFVMAGSFISAILVVIWPWVSTDAFWQHPVTWFFLLVAAIEYIIANFKCHKRDSNYFSDEKKRTEVSFSIEYLLIFVSIPWGISWVLIA